MWLGMMRILDTPYSGLVTSSTIRSTIEGSAEAVVRDSSERRLVAVYKGLSEDGFVVHPLEPAHRANPIDAQLLHAIAGEMKMSKLPG
jgi:hypothetical protein